MVTTCEGLLFLTLIDTGCFGYRFLFDYLHIIPINNRFGTLMKTLSLNPESVVFLASQKGFEPLTYGLEVRCSIQLSYWDKYGVVMESNPRNRLGRPMLYH